MIEITCTSCRTVLSIDDAFAGGVCRCQHCGTIQTVPSNLKPSARPRAPGAPPKTLYQNRAHSDAGTGLDDLASAVASSGLRSSHLRKTDTTAVASATPEVAEKKSTILWWALGAGAALVIAIVIVVVMVSNKSGSTNVSVENSNPAPNVAPAPQAPPPPVVPAGPSFCGVPLSEPSVIYVLDRGSATAPYFDAMKAALFKSLALLGPTRRFGVLLCDNDTTPVHYPAKGMVAADANGIAGLHKVLDDVVATGSTRLRPQLRGAVTRAPAVIVLVTGKYSFSTDDIDGLKQTALRGVRFENFLIADDDAPSSENLQDSAAKSGGTFHKLSPDILRQFGS